MSCSKGTFYGPSKSNPDAMLYLRADCRKLSCEFCGPKRAARYRQAIATRAAEHKLQRFMTLTLDPKKLDAGKDSISYLRDCFAKFRVYMGRRFQRSISYISIVELHKSGIAHLHVLVESYIPIDWIRASWQAVGGGKIVDIRFVDVHRVSAYLTKYITKDLLLMVPARKKRISTSRKIRLFEPKQPSNFRMDPTGINFLFEQVDGTLFDFKFDDWAGLKSFSLIPRDGPSFN